MRRSKGLVTLDDVRTHLKGQDKQALVDILMEGAMGDDRLRQRLMMKTAAKAPKSVGLATYRRAIDEAVDEEVIDSIEELLKDDRAAEVIELAEHALEAVEDAMGSVDDSDGDLGGVLDRLQEIHHQACKRAMPDPEALAERLFEWELGTDYDIFYGAAATGRTTKPTERRSACSGRFES